MKDTINALFAKPKGILAADESTNSISKRFATIHLDSNEENHRLYRQMLFTTPGMSEFISGVIMFDETIRQKTDEGETFPDFLIKNGVVPGIKVDMGTKELPNFEGEKVTTGLDGLDDRLKEYYSLGARFSKWRAVIKIDVNLPSDYCIEVNCEALAEYAALSQSNNIVPIVEPEVLMDGDHDISTAEKVTIKVHETLFKKLSQAKVVNENLILKTNMVIPGKESIDQSDRFKIAEATVRALKSGVPTNIGGIVFLSGGLDEATSTKYLNEICKVPNLPWALTFSFGRALQNSALQTWRGKPENVELAQQKFLEMAKNNSLAVEGKYE